MVKPFIKFLLFALAVILVVSIIFKVATQEIISSTEPTYRPTYIDVVPVDMKVHNNVRILDPRDTGPFLQPNLQLVKISDKIVELACNNYAAECKAKALFYWTQSAIEHQEVVLNRDHVISPEETILYRQGDSITQALLLGVLLRAQGFETRIGVSPYSAFTEVKIDGKLIRLDPGCSGCEYGTARYDGDNSTLAWVS